MALVSTKAFILQFNYGVLFVQSEWNAKGKMCLKTYLLLCFCVVMQSFYVTEKQLSTLFLLNF